MHALAGMLYAAVFSQGPHTYEAAGLDASAFNALPPEHREATQDTLHQDIHDGIEFVSSLSFNLWFGDGDIPPIVHVAVYRNEDGEMIARIVGGK
jgi:hypothetical protein